MGSHQLALTSGQDLGGDGLGNRQIAARLFITVFTVKNPVG